MSLRVAFRVDASARMGIGHVMRCLTLADALTTAGAECVFISRMADGDTKSLIHARGFEQIMLPTTKRTRVLVADDPPHAAWLDADWETDVVQTVTALSSHRMIDWLVVDHYALDARWHRSMRNSTKRLLVIDDTADRLLECDLLLNQNLDPYSYQRYEKLVPTGCHKLLGPDYALLRPVFAILRHVQRPVRKSLKAMVFLGGGDPDGLTLLALEAIEQTRPTDMTVDVVIGSANPFATTIRAWSNDRAWISIHDGNAEIAAIMADADLAVGAAGTTTWERACLGLPTVMVVIAENQRRIAEAVEEIGAAALAGDWKNVCPDAIVRQLRPLIDSAERRSAMRAAAMKLTDGKGSERVVKEMLT